jgi:hypothetical protein
MREGQVADEDKLVKAGFEVVFKPFAELIEKLAGPAAEEIGLTMKDHVRVFRMKRQLRLFQRVEEMLSAAGLEAGRVPLKTLGPIIEGASLEDDDDLQDRWAALLANAAVAKESIHPSFTEILKQLSSLEVLALDVLEQTTANEPHGGVSKGVSASMIVSVMAAWVNARDRVVAADHAATIEAELVQAGCAENLSRLGLVTIAWPKDELWLGMTLFGKRFILACRPLESKNA